MREYGAAGHIASGERGRGRGRKANLHPRLFRIPGLTFSQSKHTYTSFSLVKPPRKHPPVMIRAVRPCNSKSSRTEGIPEFGSLDGCYTPSATFPSPGRSKRWNIFLFQAFSIKDIHPYLRDSIQRQRVKKPPRERKRTHRALVGELPDSGEETGLLISTCGGSWTLMTLASTDCTP